MPELGFGEAADSFLESFIETPNEEIEEYYFIINDNWMKNLPDEEKIRAFENAKDWAEQKLSDLSKEGYKYV